MNKKEISSNEMVNVENIINYNKKVEIKDNTFQKLMFIYSLAIRQIENTMKIIQDEYDILYEYKLIDNIKTRIKKPDHIVRKMKDKNLDITYKDMITNINDIAGIRIICPMKKDIYEIQKIIQKMEDIHIIKQKDYVKNPKASGYSSYHIIAEVPVRLSDKNMYIKTEIQIRTKTMDFWAELEHEMIYKNDNSSKKQKEWKECAKLIAKLDNNMMKISSYN